MAGGGSRGQGGKGTAPGQPHPECLVSANAGIERHRAEGTRYCAGCRAYNRQRSERYRKRAYLEGPLKVPSLGSQRRIRALMVIGWPQRALEARWGLGVKTLSQVMLRPTITRDKAAVIAQGYWELAFAGAGPDQRSRLWAMRRGWPGPLDWEDIEDPREDPVPGYVVERDHAEGLRIHRAYLKMVGKRERRARMSEAERQAAREAQRRRRQAAAVVA